MHIYTHYIHIYAHIYTLTHAHMHIYTHTHPKHAHVGVDSPLVFAESFKHTEVMELLLASGAIRS